MVGAIPNLKEIKSDPESTTLKDKYKWKNLDIDLLMKTEVLTTKEMYQGLALMTIKMLFLNMVQSRILVMGLGIN